MKRNYYEVLGVACDATPEEIKAAFRAKRGALHPDREGGDAEAMAALNAAHSTLSDPEQRARYDLTLPNVERDAVNTMRDLLFKVFDDDPEDPIVIAGLIAEKSLQASRSMKTQCEKALTVMRRQLKRIQFNGKGKNIASELLEGNILNAEQEIESIEHAQAVWARVRELLGDYSYETPAPEVAQGAEWSFAQPSISTWTTV